MAASDTIKMSITGVGGHGAYPESSIDAIAVAGQVITALQQVVSRESAPLQAVVVTIGTIQGGFASNVIAPEVKMTGTVRTLHGPTRDTMEEKIRRVFEGTCRTHRAQPAFEYGYGYPVTANDPAMARFLGTCAAAVLGAENVDTDVAPVMGGEDFAYIAERVPSAYLRLGSMNPAKGITAGAHNPGYDMDEDALPLGVAVMSLAALRFVHEGGSA
jgi:amidohydrolase